MINFVLCLKFEKIKNTNNFRVSGLISKFVRYYGGVPLSTLTATSVTVPCSVRSRASARYTHPKWPHPTLRINVKQSRSIVKSSGIFSYDLNGEIVIDIPWMRYKTKEKWLLCLYVCNTLILLTREQIRNYFPPNWPWSKGALPHMKKYAL